MLTLRAAFVWMETALGQDALLQLARRSLARQRYAEARTYAARILQNETPFPTGMKAVRLLTVDAPSEGIRKDTIGVMLPLSGRYATYGEQIKRGLDLAQSEFNLRSSEKLVLTYEDTTQGESPAVTVQRLANEKQVIGIIGPLLKANAMPAALQAQYEMVPMISLSQSAGIPDSGNYIFRDTLTPQQQVRSLVEFAMLQGRPVFRHSIRRPLLAMSC